MAAAEVTQEQRDQVRAALEKLLKANLVDQVESEDMDSLWRNKIRTPESLQMITRDALSSVLALGLVAYLKPDHEGEHWDL